MLNGAVDGDDPRALAALARADAVVAALEQVGRGPRAGDVFLGSGPTAGEVLGVLRAAHPQLECREQLKPGADAGFAIGGWTAAATALQRLAALHAAIKPGGVLVLAAERGAGADVTPAWLAAHATPDWRVALYLQAVSRAIRDLYVLKRGVSLGLGGDPRQGRGALSGGVLEPSARAPGEPLVIDSGSRDRSPERRACRRAPNCWRSRRHEFGHGKTRNLGARRTRAS